MMEEPRNSPRERIAEGTFVRLRDNLRESTIEALTPQVLPDVPYRVLHVERHPEGDVAWLGPRDMSPQNAAAFNPSLTLDPSDDRFQNVYAVPVAHLQRVSLG